MLSWHPSCTTYNHNSSELWHHMDEREENANRTPRVDETLPISSTRFSGAEEINEQVNMLSDALLQTDVNSLRELDPAEKNIAFEDLAQLKQQAYTLRHSSCEKSLRILGSSMGTRRLTPQALDQYRTLQETVESLEKSILRIEELLI